MRALVCILALTLNAGHYSKAHAEESDRTADGFWQSEKARFLDSEALRVSLGQLGDPGDGGPESQEAKNPTETANQILQLLIAEMASKSGVHIETALTTVGALAGFSCQMAIRDGFIAEGRISKEDAFVEISTVDGATYYTGPLLNECLVAQKPGVLSVWGFTGGALDKLGKPHPDIVEIFRRSGKTMGGDDFGRPDLPKAHLPHQSSETLLWKYWNVSRNIMVVDNQKPNIWPYILGTVAQNFILMGKDVIDPTIAAQIVMEAAVPMSRIDPERVFAASLN